MSIHSYIKRFIFFCFFIIAAYHNTYAQNEDYVINKPEKRKAKNKIFSQLNNPDFTNYFLTSSAYTLKKRDIRLSNTDLLFSKINYGLTNNTTISLNISLIGTTVGAIKYQIDLTEQLKLGVSASIGSLARISKDSIVFLGGGQSMLTYGDYQNNITAGIGYYYVKSTFVLIRNNDQLSLYNIYMGVQRQISKRTYIVGDIIYFPRYNVITGSAGVKVIIKDNMSLCAGLMPISQEYLYINNRKIRESIIIPLLSFRMLLDRH